MNIIIEERQEVNISDNIFRLFEKHQKTCIELILESINQNFVEYINENINDIPSFSSGARRIAESLLQNLKLHYIADNRIRKDLLIKVTKHCFSSEEVSYEELMLDFPVGFALFDLNFAYHSGLFNGQNLSNKQKNDFAKGMCVSAHISTFFMFILFRFEIFQDITFLRLIKDFNNHQIYLPYPDYLRELVHDRTAKFDWSMVLNQ